MGEIIAGDLLFQRQATSEMDAVIEQTFEGYGGCAINHVGLAVDATTVIEAVEPQVRTTFLGEFLNAAAVNQTGQPQVMIFRLKEPDHGLLEGAIAHAYTLVGLPYNRSFGDRKDAYYCSELIVDCFKVANSGSPVFYETPMSFKDPATGSFLPYWVDYYAQLGLPIPEGKPGSHPALLSKSDAIYLVHQYAER